MRDITNGLDLLQAFPPKAAVTDGTAQVSNIVDRKGYDSLMLALTTGTLTDSDAVWSVLIEDSDDGTNFTAVDDAYLNGTELLAGFQFDDDNECRKIGYTGGKRYVRSTTPRRTRATCSWPASGFSAIRRVSRPTIRRPSSSTPDPLEGRLRLPLSPFHSIR
jgi:hypothetical protein